MGEAAALIAALTWSATSVALTSLSARTSPVVLSGLRLGTASLIMPLLLWISGQANDLAEASIWTLVAMVGSGFIGYGLGDTLYIRALSLIGMQKTFPISMALFISLTVIGGVLLLGEPFTWGLPLGAAFIAAGVYFIVIPGRHDRRRVPIISAAEPALATMADLPPGEPARGNSADPPPGRVLQAYIAILLTGIFWATATLWLAGAKGDIGAIAAGSLRTPAGAVGLIAFAMATQPRNLRAPFLDRRHIGAIAAAGVIGTGFGSLMYIYAVVEAGAARTAVLSATSPLLALPLSILFLGEVLNRRIGAGTLLCVAGIVLVVI
jgi:drug/metabolite transporter (DMT)-like permease